MSESRHEPRADLDAERALLGVWLSTPETFDPLFPVGDFFREGHRRIADAMGRLYRAGHAIDLIPLCDELRRTRDLDEAGGPAYISFLTDGVPIPAHPGDYARIVRKKAQERDTLRTLEQATEQVNNGNLDVALGLVANLGDPGASDGAGQARRLDEEVVRERARRAAKRQVDQEERGAVTWPEMLTLRQRLALPMPRLAYRVADVQLKDTRNLLVAQFKAGKTTLVNNLVRSLVDGDAFLGKFRVEPITGAVAVIDTELGQPMLERWLADQNIRNADRVVPISLKGNLAAFNILDERIRQDIANRLQAIGCEYVILDCIRPVMDALGLDENRDAGRLLVAFDALLADAGITEALAVQHMGHTGERSRGDSRFRDWPDAEWQLVRQDSADVGSARFFKAYGRDVDVMEQRLAFDPVSRHLTVAGGSRKDANATEAIAAIRDVLADAATPLSGRDIKKVLKESELTRAAIEAGLTLGVRSGSLRMAQGKQRANLYSLGITQVSRASWSVPSPDPDTSGECPAPYRSGHSDTHSMPNLADGDADGISF
jgi:hypothetical protein